MEEISKCQAVWKKKTVRLSCWKLDKLSVIEFVGVVSGEAFIVLKVLVLEMKTEEQSAMLRTAVVG